jgi:protein O-mannosyl-transferase
MPSAFNPLDKRTAVASLLLLAATLALYKGVSHDTFLKYDDAGYVTENWNLRAGVHSSTVRWAFRSFDQANWHPVTWLSHALDWQLFGENPQGPHAVNLLFHAANVVLLFIFLQAVTGYRGRSFMVALLFAIHPINVESVAWVAERKNLLCMFFVLWTLLAYVHYLRRPNWARYLSLLLLFALALMSKPMAVTLPLGLLLLDYWPLGRMVAGGRSRDHLPDSPIRAEARPLAWLLREKLPLFGVAAISAVVTLKAQKAAGAVVIRHPPQILFENALVSYLRYLGKAIWPARLAALYPYPDGGWPLRTVALSAASLVVITALVLRRRNRPYLLWGWLWFVGTMLPMIGLVQVGNQAMADRYAYLPFLGLFVIAVWGLQEAADRFHVALKYIFVFATVVVAVLSLVTHRQLSYWRDDFSLWSHALAVTRDNFVAEDNLGEALVRQGHYFDGIAHFQRAAELEPGDPVSEVNLGIYAQQQGDLKQAVARYHYALALTVDRQLRASAYANLGSIYFISGDYQRAQKDLGASVQLGGEFPFVFRDLGLIAQKGGSLSEAANYYALYAALEPSDLAYYLLSQALRKAGDRKRADLAYSEAQRVSTDMTATRQRAANLLDQTGQPQSRE